MSNQLIQGEKEILHEIKTFYSNLYSSSSLNLDAVDDYGFFNHSNIPKVPSDKVHLCEGSLTKDEIFNALKRAPKNKSPGSDGLPPEFYLFFWEVIGDALLASLNSAYEKGMLSNSQKQAVITLLPKPDKDLLKLSNWRPVSLLNTDYKLASRCIAKRLENILPLIIHENQSAFIPGRKIIDNIRLILDIIDLCESTGQPAAMLFIDFTKAFDTLEWNFLNKAIDLFNFGDSFKKWVSVFYNNIESCVLNNGHSIGWFQLQRGIRQGCPLSTALFVIAIELLAIAARSNCNLEGIRLPNGQNQTISGFADDTTLTLKDQKSVKVALSMLNHFKDFSGLEVNLEKTELLLLGTLKYHWKAMDEIAPTNDPIRYLGIFLGHNVTKNLYLNFSCKVKKMWDKLNIWKSRDLSIRGKTLLLKTFGISNLLYVLNSISIPDKDVSCTRSHLFNFLWRGKKHHIKNDSLIGGLEEGGLRMTDIEIQNKAFKLAWAVRISETSAPWGIIPNFYFRPYGGLKFLLKCNYNIKKMQINIPPFYKDVLRFWKELQNYSLPTTSQDAISEIFWNNENILVEGKSVCYNNWIKKGIVYIHNLIDNNGKFMSYASFISKYSISTDFVTYFGIINAIPKEWKDFIRACNHISNVDICERNVVDIGKGKSQDFYSILLKRKFVRPTAEIKFEQLDYLRDTEINWKQVWHLPYKVTIEEKLRVFQFKILHRIIATNLFLFKNKVRTDNTCGHCGQIETVEHLFWHCEIAQKLWKDVENFFKVYINVSFSCKTIILGSPNDSILLNHIILIGKYLLYASRYTKITASLKSVILKVKEIMTIEEKVLSETKFNAKWGMIAALEM